jgi:glycosyltransferase involved in cell wall biosynthesis
MIVFCHLLNDNSGSPVVLREVIAALNGRGYSTKLFVGSQGRGVLEYAGAPIQRYWYRRSRFRILTLVTFLASQWSLYRALSRSALPPDAIIYVNTLLPFGAALWARSNGHAVLYHVHEVSLSPRALQNFLVHIVQKTARWVIYVSEENRRMLPIADVPSVVVPNSIPDRIANKGFGSDYSPRRSGLFEVLMLASPRDFKGVPEMVQLARDISDRPDIRFKLVLNGDDDEIAQYMAKFDLPENLAVFPRTNTPEVFYASADLLLNLSRVDQWVETFGLTLIEGMSFGLPVIAPPLGGPTEIVTDGESGYLIDSRERECLRTAVLGLADDPEEAMAMSHAGRRRAADFTMSQFVENIAAQIQHLSASKDTDES